VLCHAPHLLSEEITKIHASITGSADLRSWHGAFRELPATNMFTTPAPSQPLLIPAGSAPDAPMRTRCRLATDISSSSSRIAGIPPARILVNIADRPARFAVEDGRVMPEPSAETTGSQEQTS